MGNKSNKSYAPYESNVSYESNKSYESNISYESNKSYESITFEVEIGLDKPKEFLRSENIDKILNSLYERKIKYCFKRRNKAMKILHSNFDTNKKEFYNYGKKSLFR